MNNIQSTLLILFFGLFTGFVSGQYLDSFPTQSNVLLWKIEGKKVKKDSYIFGTVHLIYKEKFYFPDQLTNLVKNSEQVVLEIGNVDQMEVMKYLLLEKGTIFDFFTPEQADSILMWATAKLDMEPEQFKMAFSKMKPFALVQIASQKEMISEIESYDLTIQAIANGQKIPVVGLETVAQQIALFDNMDSLQQREMVMDVVREEKTDTNSFDTLFDYYLKQNVDEMYQYIINEGGSMMESSEELLDKRNHNWIPQIEALIKKKKTFIAVGAGHLGGKEGVLRLLEKQGYTLTPVYF
ncbi:TraB/GumN family protein [Crocinitomicaceae bacterium CZZ-1]|uniref:TraB/GumN family protein n=1 Tax=Taishania pollutisoli TaxID=2766479 RepID=A0A8J6PPB1_9FLAO|nr:TraB/GumN family protein [Taishania pollutisoli]MBC9812273.1 TraB/GumN family protein [Taishania pollutisoli]